MIAYAALIIHMPNEDGTETVVHCWTDHSYFYALRAPGLSDREIERIINGIIPQ